MRLPEGLGFHRTVRGLTSRDGRGLVGARCGRLRLRFGCYDTGPLGVVELAEPDGVDAARRHPVENELVAQDVGAIERCATRIGIIGFEERPDVGKELNI